MPISTHSNTLWQRWEQRVLAAGLDDEEAQNIANQIEQCERNASGKAGTEQHEHHDLGYAHKMFDKLCTKKPIERINHSLPGHRVISTEFGAIYESSIAVRGIEKLLHSIDPECHVLRLNDGFYHVNHLPGVQPSASEEVNARNKNVERIDVHIVEAFIQACKDTGMNKRGWKKAVNEQFGISRLEFTKWLTRYFPCFGMAVPIERKSHVNR